MKYYCRLSKLMDESLNVLKHDMGYFLEEGTLLMYLYEFPVEWKTQDIYINLSDITPFKIKWLDDSSCFIKLNKEKLVLAENLNNANLAFNLITIDNEICITRYLEWKKTHVPKKKEYRKEYKKDFKKEYKTDVKRVIKKDSSVNAFERKEVKNIKATVIKDINATDKDKLVRNINGSLNKLSDANFDKLSKKIVEVIEVDQTIIPSVVDVIYEKAIDHVAFVCLYVRLCSVLNKFDNFNMLLVNKCKNTCQAKNRWTNNEICGLVILNKSENELPAEEQLEVKRAKLKRRTLGNIEE